MRKLGLIIVMIGALLTIFTAITFFTKEKVIDVGKVEVTADKPHHLSWSPLIGVGVMAIGGVIMISSRRESVLK